MVVGAQRSGTSSLHFTLKGQQGVCLSRIKEVRYFDIHFGLPFAWYRGQFPFCFRLHFAARRAGIRPVVGESSPDYMFYPWAPPRVAKALPTVRLVFLLRNPVDRAYSHYSHEKTLGWEVADVEHAFADARTALVDRAAQRMGADPMYLSHEYQHFSYLRRGLYAEQIERWLQHFDAAQMHFMFFEELRADPTTEIGRLLAFLGVAGHPPSASLASRNRLSYPPFPQALRAKLDAYYREPNALLSRLLGRDLPWPTPR